MLVKKSGRHVFFALLKVAGALSKKKIKKQEDKNFLPQTSFPHVNRYVVVWFMNFFVEIYLFLLPKCRSHFETKQRASLDEHSFFNRLSTDFKQIFALLFVFLETGKCFRSDNLLKFSEIWRYLAKFRDIYRNLARNWDWFSSRVQGRIFACQCQFNCLFGLILIF